MDRIYLVLNEIQKGTKSAKELFTKVAGTFKNNLVDFQIFLNDIEAEAYIRFLGGNNIPTYGDIILTDKGKGYIKDNKPRYGVPEFIGPCKTFGKMKCKEHFVTNIDDLCNTCFLRTKIENVRANMIMKFETLKSINTKEYVMEHLKKEIEADNKKIADMLNYENTSNSIYRENRVALFLSYKDCVQYQTEQLKIIETENIKVSEKMATITDNSNSEHGIDAPDLSEIISHVYFIGDRFIIGKGEVNGIFHVKIEDGNREYLAKAKTSEVKEEFENWYWTSYNTDELREEKDVSIINYKKRISLNQMAELLNDANKFELSTPIEKIELLLLKKEFDKINIYAEKLKWWGEKGFYLNCGHSIFLTNFSQENEKPENRLTIYPNGKDEIGHFNEFCFNEYLKSNYLSCNQELLKGKYYKRLEVGANPIEFTNREIEKQKKRYDEAKKFNKEKCDGSQRHFMYNFFVIGYDASTDGNINEIFSYQGYINKMLDMAQGYSSEQYIRFLDERLKELEQGTGQIVQTPKSIVAVSKTDNLNDKNNVELTNTINEYLDTFKDAFKNEGEYSQAVKILQDYFEGKSPAVSKTIFVRNGNKKKLAKELGMLYRMEKNESITLEYLTLIKTLFSAFSDENLSGKELNKTNLYKYCTTKKKY